MRPTFSRMSSNSKRLSVALHVRAPRWRGCGRPGPRRGTPAPPRGRPSSASGAAAGAPGAGGAPAPTSKSASRSALARRAAGREGRARRPARARSPAGRRARRSRSVLPSDTNVFFSGSPVLPEHAARPLEGDDAALHDLAAEQARAVGLDEAGGEVGDAPMALLDAAGEGRRPGLREPRAPRAAREGPGARRLAQEPPEFHGTICQRRSSGASGALEGVVRLFAPAAMTGLLTHRPRASGRLQGTTRSSTSSDAAGAERARRPRRGSRATIAAIDDTAPGPDRPRGSSCRRRRPRADAPSEMRGLWVVRTALVSPEAVDAVVDQARSAGFNALFVQVRGRGDAFYASRLVPRSRCSRASRARSIRSRGCSRRARAAGSQVHAWVNVLLSAHFVRPLPAGHVAAAHPEWLMVPAARPRAGRRSGRAPRDLARPDPRQRRGTSRATTSRPPRRASPSTSSRWCASCCAAIPWTACTSTSSAIPGPDYDYSRGRARGLPRAERRRFRTPSCCARRPRIREAWTEYRRGACSPRWPTAWPRGARGAAGPRGVGGGGAGRGAGACTTSTRTGPPGSRAASSTPSAR